MQGGIMRNSKGGKTSSVVKDRYNKKTYQQVNFRVKSSGFPTKEDIEESAKNDNMSLNSWLVNAVVEKMNGGYTLGIKDLAAYARSSGMTEEDYIKTAVMEKMKRQDDEFREDITRESCNE